MKKDGTIVYFNSGAIGEFLMTLYFADLAKHSAELSGVPVPLVVVPVRRNALLVAELAKEYTNVQVISIESGKAWGGFKQLTTLPTVRVVLTQQTFSILPLQLKLFAYAVARYTRATFAGYRDASAVNDYMYDTLWQFDSNVLFPVEMHNLAERLGYPCEYVQPKLTYTGGTSVFTSPYFIFHLKSFTLSRTLPESRWHTLIERLRAEYPHTAFIFSGSKDDKEMIDLVTAGISNCKNTAGSLPIGDLIAALDGADLFIGVDTGITHLAAFRGVPMVVLGTNSTPCWWATYNPKSVWLQNKERCACLGDKLGDCQEYAEGANRFRCLLDISNETVLDAVKNNIHA
jgi:ADP-heptose:LPS heptosyltransferase